MTRSSNRYLIGAVAIAIVAGTLWIALLETESVLQLVTQAYEAGDYAAVEELLAKEEAARPLSDDLLWYAGLTTQAQGDFDEALVWFNQLLKQTSDDRLSVKAGLQVAAVYQGRSMPGKAADSVLTMVQSYPKDARLRRKAASLLDAAGRRFEGNIQHLELLRLGEHTVDDLVLLADRHEPFVDKQIEAALEKADATVFRVAQALIAWRSGKLGQAEDLLRAEISVGEASLESHALLGIVLVDKGAFDALPAWHKGLPVSSERHPDVWYVRGVWAEHLDRKADAATCYRRAIQLDSGYRQALFRLSLVADATDVDLLRQIAATTQQLDDYRQVCKSIFFSGPQLVAVTKAIDLAESVGRLEEAIGWCKILNSKFREFRSQDRLRDLQAKLKLQGKKEVAEWLRIADSDLPVAPFVESDPANASAVQQIAGSQFSNNGADCGLVFEYKNGTEERSGLMIQQSMGGGVAAIDFDRDSWPDLFFPQGKAVDSNLNDALFRNRLGQSFELVTSLAGCSDVTYSHGVAAGDINNDGFPDLYVANAGRNHLYVNNGDGTFGVVSGLAASETWSMSCAIADANGDSFPDLLDVNYLEWQRPFNEVCNDSELGVPRTCPPERFDGASNELHLNTGQGSFVNSTQASGLQGIVGKSLGVIAGNFGGSDGTGFFIANDQVPNSLLVAERREDDVPVFSNQAITSGLAFDGLGDAYACMGIAAGDVNHDGLLDMFVTNFYRQPNTLYLAIAPGSYRDATRSSGLLEPGLLKLGFGTQFLDANLDGELDLVVGNGHLDDFTHKDIPFEMQPQLFMNQGGMQFQECQTAGSFFDQPRLSRGMATLDWNRDGLADFAVSNIASASSLVTNVTQKHGNFFAVTLVGNESSRDAIGATVSVTTAVRTTYGHQVAGDGYASSNERRLLFGLGSESSVTKLIVSWPSGVVQEFADVAGGSEYILSESADRLFAIPQ